MTAAQMTENLFTMSPQESN